MMHPNQRAVAERWLDKCIHHEYHFVCINDFDIPNSACSSWLAFSERESRLVLKLRLLSTVRPKRFSSMLSFIKELPTVTETSSVLSPVGNLRSYDWSYALSSINVLCLMSSDMANQSNSWPAMFVTFFTNKCITVCIQIVSEAAFFFSCSPPLSV